MKVQGKRTLITGATSGIGKATAFLFAECGSDLVLLAPKKERLGTAAEEIQAKHNVTVDVLPADVRDIETTQKAVKKLLDQNPIQIAIINHGIGQYGRVSHSAWNDLDNVLQTNITGTFAVAHAVIPTLLKQGMGSLVFITSVLDKRPIPNHAVYCASKSAMHNFANVVRLELRPKGIHVGVVAPSRTDTDLFKNMIYSEPQRDSVVEITSPASRVATVILRCVERKRREITVSATGKLYTFFGYHFPRITDWLISRAIPKPKD